MSLLDSAALVNWFLSVGMLCTIKFMFPSNFFVGTQRKGWVLKGASDILGKIVQTYSHYWKDMHLTAVRLISEMARKISLRRWLILHVTTFKTIAVCWISAFASSLLPFILSLCFVLPSASQIQLDWTKCKKCNVCNIILFYEITCLSMFIIIEWIRISCLGGNHPCLQSELASVGHQWFLTAGFVG